MTNDKRPAEGANESSETSTPAKRPKTDLPSALPALAAAGNVDSSPVVTDSPSNRGNSAGRGGGRGGKGSSRGGADKRGGRGGRGRGADDRNWGGRNSGSKQGGKMRSWGKKEGEDGEPEAEEDKKERLPKKKVAVLIGYNGIGYSGSQMNPGIKTVEGAVFQAMVDAGAISADNSDSPQKVGLSRAARTDAGVHAAVNVISLKMILNPPLLPESTTLEAYINTFLPKTIRVWSILRVQGGFNPRALCDQRQYEYTLPTHVFLGPKPGTNMDIWLKKSRALKIVPASPAVESVDPSTPVTTTTTEEVPPPTADEIDAAAALSSSDAFWASRPEGSDSQSDQIAKREWRISPALLESARKFVKTFEGSHNYCNFTVGKDFRDRSNQRVMKKLEISDPFVVNGVEHVSIGFLGQSFMLNQIRKMVGLAILAVRSSTPSTIIPETFGPSRIHIPKAPGLGLLLDEPQFFEYNKRIIESNEKLDGLLAIEKIEEKEFNEQKRDLVEIEKVGVKPMVDAFKKEEIYKRMWEVEEKDGVFTKWVNFLDNYPGPDFEYLNSKGIIPASAIFKKGENTDKVRLPEGAVVAEDAAPPSDDEEGPVDKDNEG